MVAQIPLTHGLVSLIDEADLHAVSQFKWTAKNDGRYAYRTHRLNGKRQAIYLHRFIMPPPDGLWIDHIDGNGLNNQRHNLRFCTPQQNTQNSRGHFRSSKYKGVGKTPNGRWATQLRVDGKPKRIGYFDTEIEAALCYDRAASELHGEFARLNFGGKYPLFGKDLIAFLAER